MKKFIHIAFLFSIVICIISLTLPLSANAQYSRRGSSTYRSKINKLDDDVVRNLPIPVLFGVKLSMITPNFADPRDGGSRSHEGLDIMAPKGAPIVSPTEAVVIQTGSGSSAGKYVTTANPGGETFVYMHLDEILVKNGDELDVGDIIGSVGNTGNASGGAAHLHFEVRNSSRGATDPYPRITKEFSLEDKIEYLEDTIEAVSDETKLINFVVQNYATELVAARNANIDLPGDIESTLPTTIITTTTTTTTTPGDLALNSQGQYVVILQTFLIAKNTGPQARTLGATGATGFFGPITQRALIEYQVANGISPATGYFGPVTQQYILTHER